LPKDAPHKATGTGKPYFRKCSMVFVKFDGKWMAVMDHATPSLYETTVSFFNQTGRSLPEAALIRNGYLVKQEYVF